jgi:metal-sulfur cluster biosynthetic enzyme
MMEEEKERTNSDVVELIEHLRNDAIGLQGIIDLQAIRNRSQENGRFAVRL